MTGKMRPDQREEDTHMKIRENVAQAAGKAKDNVL